ncbi:CHAT domain-containing protein [Mycolicibacterium goodii]|uniref:CHAT domain-containing protein n=1 Tax=Mycolicibacterium goodii TaxID=134601 RepID=UPI001BDBBFAF|nr:CHAT domain-containing protein [Mycolicibacterium goodii]MBU8817873.1 CHAT domain-containing protein [Mycolicibacterium goodii]
MGDLAVTTTLVLRFADVGVATYASLRVVGQPSRTLRWVLEEPDLPAVYDALDNALPDPRGTEPLPAAVERSLKTGPFVDPKRELKFAKKLGGHLIPPAAWKLLVDCVSAPRATLFITPSPKLARVPWGQLAMPGLQKFRLMELADVLMAVPPNIVHAPRRSVSWAQRRDNPALLVLDPRIPGQRPDSPLGSVLGRPSPDTALSRHFAPSVEHRRVLPEVADPVELFRRPDVDRSWLARACEREPARLLYVGHASAGGGDTADRAALHLAEPQPLSAADVIAQGFPVPPRVALMACASGGDYRFDEATGLVAAMVLGGAQLVTATLWSLPTTAGFRTFTPSAHTGDVDADPMADTVIGVDSAHTEEHAGIAVNRWQRAQMRRWREGDTTASPLYWAALATFAVDGAR